jgi:pimeloyl-[acyl-carrier protein] methyl ester esterase
MYIESVGRGPDLVFIHGWAMHGGIFAPLSELLSDRFRLHLVDLPGHGFSSDEKSPLDPAACAANLVDKLPRAIWIGWSLGGLVSLKAALDHADRVRGIVEIASSPHFLSDAEWPHGVSQETFEQFETGLRDDYRVVVERFLALEVLGSHDAQAELRELRPRVFARGEPALSALHEGMRILETVDLRPQMRDIAVPNLWIAGRRDRLVPPDAMRWASRQNTLGEFLEVSSGHAPFIAYAKEVADAISSFAGRIAP